MFEFCPLLWRHSTEQFSIALRHPHFPLTQSCAHWKNIVFSRISGGGGSSVLMGTRVSLSGVHPHSWGGRSCPIHSCTWWFMHCECRIAALSVGGSLCQASLTSWKNRSSTCWGRSILLAWHTIWESTTSQSLQKYQGCLLYGFCPQVKFCETILGCLELEEWTQWKDKQSLHPCQRKPHNCWWFVPQTSVLWECKH